MPLFFQRTINDTTQAAVWHITEAEAFFIDRVPLHRSVTHPHKRLQHLAGRYLLRFLVPDFPLQLIQIADTNKPYLANEMYHFSISHCGDFAAAIVSSQCRVGIDIEKVTDKILRIQHKFFSAAEQKILMSAGDYAGKERGLPVLSALDVTILWSCKEAVFKWYGRGEVDFKKHMTLQRIDFPTTTDCRVDIHFLKDATVRLPLAVKFFDPLVMSYVVT